MRIVMKFGGTSVADLDRIDHVASRIQKMAYDSHEIIVVVSAMAGVTNQLVAYVEHTSPIYDLAECDTVLSTGEQITAGLLAIKLKSIGLNARSWLAWQIPLYTNAAHGNACVLQIDTTAIERMLQNGAIAVCAGFQGVSFDSRITTLGRGGSDLTAVALAAALQADRCDIFTDVNGIYTADPRIVKKAYKIEKMNYQEMLEFASSGARVLQTQSVAMAMQYKVCIQVLSSFEEGGGTFVMEDDQDKSYYRITGLSHKQNEIYICLYQIPQKLEILSLLANFLFKEEIAFNSLTKIDDMVSFFIQKESFNKWRSKELLLRRLLGFSKITTNDEIARISLIGNYLQHASGILCGIFDLLKEHGVALYAIQTTSTQISIVVPSEYTELLLRLLHDRFLEDKKYNEGISMSEDCRG